MPVLAALLLFALTVLTFLAVQLYCAESHGFVDNRNVRTRLRHFAWQRLRGADADAASPRHSGVRCSPRGSWGWARGFGRRT